MVKLIPLISCFFVSLSAICQTSGSPAARAEKIDQYISACNKAGVFNGVILVAEGGKVVFEKAVGFSDFRTSEQLTTRSSFYLASVSKQFTAMAIMILKERNKLSYEDRLSTYFPEFPAYADGVTIRHLLQHTSGIADYFRLGAYQPNLKNSDVLKKLMAVPHLDFEPGEHFSYSNGGYVLLAMIVEKASGMPFHEFMHQNIFEPLGMNNTLVYDESRPSVRDRALGFNMMDALDDYELLTSGDGGIFSTASDLFRWDQALYTDRLVTPRTLEDAFIKTKLNNGELKNYGFGWSLRTVGSKKYVEHYGGLSGFRSFIQRELTMRRTLILLTNHGDASALYGIGEAINQIMDGLEYSIPKSPVSLTLVKLLKSHSPQRAVAKMNELLSGKPDLYHKDENGINNLGYRYLNMNQLDVALPIFRFNLSLFPNSSNTYDSYGEALLAKGDTALAVANYRRSVELNPGNAIAIAILSRLGEDVAQLTRVVTINPEILDMYVGRYVLTPEFVFTISRKDQQLVLQPDGQSAFPIYPVSETRFYLKEVNAQIEFNKNAGGNVVSFTLYQDGERVATKLD